MSQIPPKIDENTFKFLTRRLHRKMKNESSSDQSGRSLGQLQNAVAQALGYKDLHEAQSAWACQQTTHPLPHDEDQKRQKQDVLYFLREKTAWPTDKIEKYLTGQTALDALLSLQTNTYFARKIPDQIKSKLIANAVNHAVHSDFLPSEKVFAFLVVATTFLKEVPALTDQVVKEIQKLVEKSPRIFEESLGYDHHCQNYVLAVAGSGNLENIRCAAGQVGFELSHVRGDFSKSLMLVAAQSGNLPCVREVSRPDNVGIGLAVAVAQGNSSMMDWFSSQNACLGETEVSVFLLPHLFKGQWSAKSVREGLLRAKPFLEKTIPPLGKIKNQYQQNVAFTVIKNFHNHDRLYNSAKDLLCDWRDHDQLSLNEKDDREETPLDAANDYNDNARMIEVLLEAGADPNLSRAGPAGLALSLLRTQTVDNERVLSLLIERCPDKKVLSPLMQDCNTPEQAQKLLNMGVPLDPHKALDWGVFEASPLNELVSWALRNGISPTWTDAEGNTLLHYVAQKSSRFLPAMETLVECGAPLQQPNNAGQRPLDVATPAMAQAMRVLEAGVKRSTKLR